MNILVLCTGNSARSILLEAILNARGNSRVTAFSAGSHPAGAVHPGAMKLLKANGFETDHLRSKSWGEFAGSDAPIMDAVITVCSNAANETCPIWPGVPVQAHWGVDDPASAPEDRQDSAFKTAYDILSARADNALAREIEKMAAPTLKRTLDEIGQLL